MNLEFVSEIIDEEPNKERAVARVANAFNYMGEEVIPDLKEFIDKLNNQVFANDEIDTHSKYALIIRMCSAHFAQDSPSSAEYCYSKLIQAVDKCMQN